MLSSALCRTLFRYTATRTTFIPTQGRNIFQYTRAYPLVSFYAQRNYCEVIDTTSRLKDPEEIKKRIISVVKAFNKVNPEKVAENSNFKDLGLDSLDTVELVLAIEEEFSIEIPDEASDAILSIPDAINYLATHPHLK